jgi:FAD/FMN-containing dehydrogenase
MTAATIELSGQSGGPVTVPSGALEDLAGRVQGRLLGLDDPGWDDAVRIWNGLAATAPALVLQPASAADVAAAVGFARAHGLLLGVKGGGHNIAGTAIAEGGLTIDLSGLREVTVDPEAGLAHVGPGCRLADVDRATQAHGLATPLGFISKVGVAGLTLGGGLGYLTRRFGWTADNLVEAEVVCADGQVRTASRERHPELFWALRGGGGNLGVVTRFSFQLHPVGPRVLGGLIAWPFERATEVMAAYRKLTAAAPRDLATWLILLNAPPAPFVPAAWHGRRLCAFAVCHSGDPGDAERDLAPVRALGDSVFDLLGSMPYTEVQSYLDDTEPDGHHFYWRTEFLAGLEDGLLAAMRELFADCPVPEAELGLLHLEGALNERPADDGAVGNRDAHYVLGVKGMWAPGEPAAGRFSQWVRDAGTRLRPWSTGATYINFQTADEGDDRVRATYGANYDRLVEVKRRYDPGNLFRANRNIRP